MRIIRDRLNPIVAAVLAAFYLVQPASADPAAEQRLLEALRRPDQPEWQRIESDLMREWSKSGSASMDLLLQRGRDAMEAGDLPAAVGHLTALTDHAPEFAEGWNALATALYLSGQFGPAVEDIRRTLLINPNHYGALTGLGVILEELDKPQEALRAYRAAQTIHPHEPDIKAAVERLDKKVSGQAL